MFDDESAGNYFKLDPGKLKLLYTNNISPH